MKHSENLDQLATALHQAQGKIEAATKDSQNPHFKSTYASLQAIDAAIRPAAQECGLSYTMGAKETPIHVVESVSYDDKGQSFPVHKILGAVTATMTLLHVSGQWITHELTVPYGRQGGPQGAIGALTFARRALLKAAFAMIEEDDDGEGLHGRGSQRQQAPAPPPQIDAETVMRMLEHTSTVDGCRDIFAKHIGTRMPGPERTRLEKAAKERAAELEQAQEATT